MTTCCTSVHFRKNSMNRYNPDIHRRRSIRLKEYDYSQAGAYFITICAQGRECLFGEIVNGEMCMSEYGQIIEAEWIRMEELRSEVEIGEYVVMPNHFHGIIVITNDGTNTVGAIHELPLPVQQRRKMVVPKVVGRFKMITAKRINIIRDTPGIPIWQRNYYDHVIRNDADYNRITDYIIINPKRWAEDTLHPKNFVPARVPIDGTNVDGVKVVGDVNIGGDTDIGDDADIVGAIHELPLRNLPRPGDCHE